jgi:hypothetical protein
MLAEVRDAPFIPWHWGKNQKGMQATEECNEIVVVEGIDRVTFSREEAWQLASLNAASVAEALMNAGYHKQVTNRLLEPFMWIDALISATEWKNFIALRDHKAAEPHFRDLAQMMKEAIEGAPVQYLAAGQWHTPYVNASEGLDVETSLKVSAARCARISYAPFDGKADIAAELARYDLLMKDAPRHASPVEHQATPGNGPSGNFAPGWIQYRKTIEGEALHG